MKRTRRGKVVHYVDKPEYDKDFGFVRMYDDDGKLTDEEVFIQGANAYLPGVDPMRKRVKFDELATREQLVRRPRVRDEIVLETYDDAYSRPDRKPSAERWTYKRLWDVVQAHVQKDEELEP